MKPWKNSASVILLAKNLITNYQQPSANNFKVLLQKRSKRGSFANSMVFPGGTVSECDSENKWLDYFKSFGFGRDEFNVLQKPNIDLHHITLDGEDSIRKHVSLRITAIRETFEELGILICKTRKHSNVNKHPYASYITDFDIKYWQEKVHNDPTAFLVLCKELDCYPDIWSLYLWSNWLTPIKFVQTPRFNTVFFLTAFEEQPPILIEKTEVVHSIWTDAIEVLDAYSKNELTLVFPQWFELSRLRHYKDIDKFINFAAKRSCYGCDLFYPVFFPATDGIAITLPGDEMYPDNPDYASGNKNFEGVESLEELRNKCTVLHRAEMKEMSVINFVTKNYTPRCHHLSLDNGNIPDIPSLKSSL